MARFEIVDDSLLLVSGYLSWTENLDGVKKYLEKPDLFTTWYDIFISKCFEKIHISSLIICDMGLDKLLTCESFKKVLIYYFVKIEAIKKDNNKKAKKSTIKNSDPELTRLRESREFWKTERLKHNAYHSLSLICDNPTLDIGRYNLLIYKENNEYVMWVEHKYKDGNVVITNKVFLVTERKDLASFISFVKDLNKIIIPRGKDIVIDESMKKHILESSMIQIVTMENQISERDMFLAQCKN